MAPTGTLALGYQRISEAQLSNYVDGWVGILTAPLSPVTSELMRRERAGAAGFCSRHSPIPAGPRFPHWSNPLERIASSISTAL